MEGNTKPRATNPTQWQDLFLDVIVPLVFAILTAGFWVLAAQL